MVKRQGSWVHSPTQSSKAKVPESVKADVERKAAGFVEQFLKPMWVEPPPDDAQFNYIVDIYTKWYRHYFFFCAKYACPGPNAVSPHFEAKFARMEHVGGNRFNLSFMRHTGQWVEVYGDLSLEESLEAIKDDPWFHP